MELLKQIRRIQSASNIDLNSLPHLRHVPALSPPALCRHIVIFIESSGRDENAEGRFQMRLESISRLIQDIIADHGRPKYLNNVIEGISKDFSRDRTVVASVDDFIAGFDMRVKAEISTEYCTISFYMDNFASGQGTIHSIDDLASRVKTYIEGSYPRCIEDEFAGSDILHIAFWDAVEERLGRNFGSKGNRELINDEGVLIGDFRGVVLPVVTSMQHEKPAKSDDAGRFASEIMPMGVRMDSGNATEVHLADTFISNIKFFYNVLGIDADGRPFSRAPVDLHLESNVILCHMLDGLAIYGSTLGNHRLLAKLKKEPIPVCYVLIYGGASKFELGRLVQRLHLLGEYRVAALIDYDTVRRLSLSIRELGQLITEAIYNYSTSRTIASSKVSEVVGCYGEIGKKCNGGLIFRINRSEYYRTSLYSTITHLHQRPITGWQSYMEFIELNVAPRFRTINSIGDRYKQIAIRIDRLVSIYDISRQFSFNKLVSFASLLALLAGTIGIFFVLKKEMIEPLREEFSWRPTTYWLSLSFVGFIQITCYLFLTYSVIRFLRSHQIKIK